MAKESKSGYRVKGTQREILSVFFWGELWGGDDLIVLRSPQPPAARHHWRSVRHEKNSLPQEFHFINFFTLPLLLRLHPLPAPKQFFNLLWRAFPNLFYSKKFDEGRRPRLCLPLLNQFPNIISTILIVRSNLIQLKSQLRAFCFDFEKVSSSFGGGKGSPDVVRRFSHWRISSHWSRALAPLFRSGSKLNGTTEQAPGENRSKIDTASLNKHLMSK